MTQADDDKKLRVQTILQQALDKARSETGVEFTRDQMQQFFEIGLNQLAMRVMEEAMNHLSGDDIRLAQKLFPVV